MLTARVSEPSRGRGVLIQIPRATFEDMRKPEALRLVQGADGHWFLTRLGLVATWRAYAVEFVKTYVLFREDGLGVHRALRFGLTLGDSDEETFKARVSIPVGDYGIVRFPPAVQLLPIGETAAWWRSQHDYPEHREAQDGHAERLTQWLVSQLQPLGRSFLEVGCGAGRNLLHLRGELHGFDVNPEAIQVAQRLLPNADLQVGDALTQLRSRPDQSIDVVFTAGVLMHIPDVDEIIAEMSRVARKAVVLSEMHGEPRDYDFWRYPRDYRRFNLPDTSYEVFGDWRSDGTPGFRTALLVARKT
jgi:hypothetical protein